MSNTTEDKLQKLLSTKAGIKNAINGSGSTVGDNFSEYPTAITDGKALIAAAVTDKGVETAADATFQQMANNIAEIPTGTVMQKYTITSDSYNIFYPEEAYPGQYVTTVDGTALGVSQGYDETLTYLLVRSVFVSSLERCPPEVQEIIKNSPSVFAPPAGRPGYFYFTMPNSNVVMKTYQ